MHTNLSARIHKIFLVLMVAATVLILGSTGNSSSIANTQPQRGVYHTVTTLAEIQQTVKDDRVSTLDTSIKNLIISEPSMLPSSSAVEQQVVSLPKTKREKANGIGGGDSPDYVVGCSATAAKIKLGGMDRGGFEHGGYIQTVSGLEAVSALNVVWVNMNTYPNIYTGPTNGGVMPLDNSSWPKWTDGAGDTYSNNPLAASHIEVDGRTTRGTIDDYWVSYESEEPDPYITGGWPQHAWGDAVGDYMYTSQSAFGNIDGETSFFYDPTSANPATCADMSSNSEPDGTLGMKQFLQARGYAVGACYNQQTDNAIAGGFSFAQFKAEIDAGWPVLLGVEGHTIVGIGYDAASNLAYVYNGWDNNIHTMEWKAGCYNPAKNCSVSYQYPDTPPYDYTMPLQLVSIVRIVPGTPNFYTISGNTGVAGATVTYNGGFTTTDSTGHYSFTVSESWFGTVTPSKAGYTFRPSSKSYANVVTNQPNQDYNDLNLLLDPSFELGSPNTYWTETSTNYGTPLCTTDCLLTGETTPRPRTGLVWGWFGGTSDNETASLSQWVTIPNGSATLKFYLWISYAGSDSDANDKFIVRIDGAEVFSANATQTATYSTYKPVTVDVSNYADGISHKITFISITTGQQVDFNLDDVSLTGRFTISGNAGVAGATLIYTDGSPKTVAANGSGNYSINVPFYWNGTITPSKPGYLFSPVNHEYTNLSGNQTAQNFTATPIIPIISGNAGIGGATLTYTGGSTTADGNGDYSFPVPYNWTGTVTPSKTGYAFAPFGKTYTNVVVDQTSQNYSAEIDTTPPTVSSITLANGNPTAAANVNFTVTFSEPVTGVDTVAPFDDFSLTTSPDISGASVTGVSGSGAAYTVTVNTGTNSGTIRLDVIDHDTILDNSGNTLGGTGVDNGNFTGGEFYTIYKSGGDTAGVFRPSTATFYLRNSNSAGSPNITVKLGKTGDYPVVGDWDGDGTDTIGIYRNGIFYLSNSNTTGHVDLTFAFGVKGDQPIAGDWNGDGKDTIGVYRSSKITFLLRNTNSAGAADATFKLGNPGDVGIAGDWNADGKDTTGVFRPSNGAIYLKNANTTGYADTVITYGVKNDKPVTGDWNNDGIASIGIFRNAKFYLRNTNTKGYADFVFAFGAVGDMPLAGNWDGMP